MHAWVEAADGETLDTRNADVAAVVGRLRRYLDSCDAGAVREFVASHVYYSGYDHVDEHGVTQIKKSTNLYTYHLPDLATMKHALDATVPGRTFPVPVTGSLLGVCSKWFFFVIGRCLDSVYDNTLRKTIFDKGIYATARDLDFAIAPVRDRNTHREKPHTHSAIAFLSKLGEISEVMPNQQKGGKPIKVLPSRTNMATHQLYVFDVERRAGASWANAQEKELPGWTDETPREKTAARALRKEFYGPDAKGQEEGEAEEEDKVQQEKENEIMAKHARKRAARRRKEKKQRRQDQEENGCAEYDEPEGQQEKNQEDDEPEGQQRQYWRRRKKKGKKKKTKYRYGNKMCGPVCLTRPEYPGVARSKCAPTTTSHCHHIAPPPAPPPPPSPSPPPRDHHHHHHHEGMNFSTKSGERNRIWLTSFAGRICRSPNAPSACGREAWSARAAPGTTKTRNFRSPWTTWRTSQRRRRATTRTAPRAANAPSSS